MQLRQGYFRLTSLSSGGYPRLALQLTGYADTKYQTLLSQLKVSVLPSSVQTQLSMV